MTQPKPTLNFDDIYLCAEPGIGGTHLATPADVTLARAEEAGPLLLSNEAELFCTLIVLHGLLPSAAYVQAFTKEVDGQVIKPDLPSYSARKLCGTLEVKTRIQELRDEVVEWGKTSFEEIEANMRAIALNPGVKDSDRNTALKNLAALRGFGTQEGGPGGTITINLPFTPNNLTPSADRVVETIDNLIST